MTEFGLGDIATIDQALTAVLRWHGLIVWLDLEDRQRLMRLLEHSMQTEYSNLVET